MAIQNGFKSECFRLEQMLDGNYTINIASNIASNIEQVLDATPNKASSYTATYIPSRKLSKVDEPDMQNTAGEVFALIIHAHRDKAIFSQADNTYHNIFFNS